MKYSKILITVLACLLLNNFGFAQMGDFKSGSEPDGFRGFKWGTSFSSFSNMKILETDPSYGGINQYIMTGDDLNIGAAKLDKIEYKFWRNKFCSVDIITKGYVNWSNLREAAFEKFGEGFKGNTSIEQYYWTGGQTSIILDYDRNAEIGVLYMNSKQCSQEKEAFKTKKAKEGAKGF